MNTLRSIIGETRRDSVRNKEVRDQCEIIDINKFVKGRKKEWNNHVRRRRDDRIAKIARDMKPLGRRGIGRPQQRWSAINI
ncbi:hypothetical protein ANN_08806 [Periplaneta americana]|uniref:Uncharacterized protein n=1 Tax=Periplaneta americana TaxID=6978 RepID=A0ABQ8T3N1_PERAM|nr:hypothetical protein ANN_08806 [Periplaneta americana]